MAPSLRDALLVELVRSASFLSTNIHLGPLAFILPDAMDIRLSHDAMARYPPKMPCQSMPYPEAASSSVVSASAFVSFVMHCRHRSSACTLEPRWRSFRGAERTQCIHVCILRLHLVARGTRSQLSVCSSHLRARCIGSFSCRGSYPRRTPALQL